ncbi:MAG: formimidoylglutamate deiminase [Haliangiales bacterium]
MVALIAKHALLPTGWADDVAVTIGADGAIDAASPGRADDAAPAAAQHAVDASPAPTRPAAEQVAGVAVPGVPNLHSHAFQRAMAGLGERAAEPGAGQRGPDSFWSWRQVMYQFVDTLEPGDVRAIAAQLYLEMVLAGYTAVAEFHYLHHDPRGRPYADRAAMAMAIVEAAREVGIGLTLLPVLYQYGGFGAAAPVAGQRRFVNDLDGYQALVADLCARCQGDPQLRVGIAPHSLRAVSPASLRRCLEDFDRLDQDGPIHIHIAEQTREVDECVVWSGQRPVAWLLEHAPVDARWCLVHATHIDASELTALAATDAVVGLCPSTEANLGDGLFPLGDYLAAGGRVGVGSDSQVSVDPIEELRWLEYGQRLRYQIRNVAASAAQPATGARLYRAALAGGAQALGRPLGALAPGHRGDLVVLDPAHPILVGRGGDRWLDAWVFSGNRRPVRDVMIGGRWVVRDGHHPAEAEINDRYRRTMERLLC